MKPPVLPVSAILILIMFGFLQSVSVGSASSTTSVSLTSSANPVVSYQFVTFTATVSGSNGSVPDGELVAFLVNGNAIFTNTTTAGVATVSTAFSPAGSYQVIASYAGDASNSASNSTLLVETVNLIPTAVSLTSSANPSFSGEHVTFTATVSATSDIVPGGDSVTFLDGSSVIGTSTTSSGSAIFTTPSLSVGSHNITAAFSSDGTFAASTSSPAISQVVNALSIPAIPSSVTATAISSGTITVSWTPSYSAAGYDVYRSTSPSGPFTLVGSTAGSSFDSTGLIPNTTYYFEVSAANGAGTSGLSSQVSATTLLGGKATSCSNLWSCNFTLTDGSATGFVNIHSGSVSFRLPGETNTTNAGNVYSITYTQRGYYHVTGKFVTTDVNTGKVVKFVTDVWITARGHSGRGGGITYSLHNGTITYTLTGQDPTATTVACNPSNFAAGHSTTCTVTVTDKTNSTSLPTGTVSFGTSVGYYGTFSNGGTCTLSSGSCSVVFQTNEEYGGTIPIYASYSGDGTHYQSQGSTALYVTVGD